jgi:hypothetical protein
VNPPQEEDCGSSDAEYMILQMVQKGGHGIALKDYTAWFTYVAFSLIEARRGYKHTAQID